MASWILVRPNRCDMHETATCWPINHAAYSSGDQIINYLGTIKHYSQQTRSQISDITNCELRTSFTPEAWLHRWVATVLVLEPPLRHLNHADWCHYWGEMEQSMVTWWLVNTPRGGRRHLFVRSSAHIKKGKLGVKHDWRRNWENEELMQMNRLIKKNADK